MQQMSVLWPNAGLPSFLLIVLDLSTPSVVVKDSTMENRFDVGVILFVHVLRRVQVKSVGVSGVKDDEDGVPATTQNKYTSN